MPPCLVYESLAAHQQVEEWDHRHLMPELHVWWERFNDEFKLAVPSVSLRIDRLRGNVLGHHRRGHNGFGLRHEVALNTLHLGNRPWWRVLCTLCHEALHAWQEEYGKIPKVYSYHNREFREKAATLGLIVNTDGVTLVDEGPFLAFVRRHKIEVPEVMPTVPTHRQSAGRSGTSKLRRWTCGCGYAVRVAVAQFRARCLVCERDFARDD